MNVLIIFLTAIIPLIVGILYYNEKTMGKAWMKETGISKDDGAKVNMPLVFGMTYLFSLFATVALMQSTIHQNHIQSIFVDLNTEAAKADMAVFMEKYGMLFRTFGHGAFHGILSAIFFGLPLIGISALFERKSFKYIFIHLFYFIICFALMGGILCQFMK